MRGEPPGRGEWQRHQPHVAASCHASMIPLSAQQSKVLTVGPLSEKTSG
jgi:hypothetical protein